MCRYAVRHMENSSPHGLIQPQVRGVRASPSLTDLDRTQELQLPELILQSYFNVLLNLPVLSLCELLSHPLPGRCREGPRHCLGSHRWAALAEDCCLPRVTFTAALLCFSVTLPRTLKGQSQLIFWEVGKLSPSVSWGCHETWWFKTTKIYSPTFLEARSLKSYRATLLPGVLGENLCFFWLLVTQRFLSLQDHRSSLCPHLHTCASFHCVS